MEDQLDEGMYRALVSVRGDQVVTNSRIIADIFGKSHKNVLRAIRQLGCSEGFRRRNFEPTDFIDKNGDRQPQFLITRNGCMFLIMGFTGAKADAFKEAFINAFNWMEAMLRERDELDRRINDHSTRALRSANDGSYHGRGLALRRIEKSRLAIEEMKLRGEAQLRLLLDQDELLTH
ncbi:Rha family transcriptional regulator [Aeromonas veronii]|nr:Rha family transcriptional regulator [Aeromonas veronii]